MNMDSTIEVRAVVTPNWAMASLSHTTSYRMLQKPETKNRIKKQNISFPETLSTAKDAKDAKKNKQYANGAGYVFCYVTFSKAKRITSAVSSARGSSRVSAGVNQRTSTGSSAA
jgi:hypothetical protein